MIGNFVGWYVRRYGGRFWDGGEVWRIGLY